MADSLPAAPCRPDTKPIPPFSNNTYPYLDGRQGEVLAELAGQQADGELLALALAAHPALQPAGVEHVALERLRIDLGVTDPVG